MYVVRVGLSHSRMSVISLRDVVRLSSYRVAPKPTYWPLPGNRYQIFRTVV